MAEEKLPEDVAGGRSPGGGSLPGAESAGGTGGKRLPTGGPSSESVKPKVSKSLPQVETKPKSDYKLEGDTALGKARSATKGATKGAAEGALKGAQQGGAHGAALGGVAGAVGGSKVLGAGGTSIVEAAQDPSISSVANAVKHNKGKLGAASAAAAAQPITTVLVLLALLNWLKSMFFMLMAFVMNFWSILWAIVKAIAKAIAGAVVGFVKGIGSAIAGGISKAASFLGFGGGAGGGGGSVLGVLLLKVVSGAAAAVVVATVVSVVTDGGSETAKREGDLLNECDVTSVGYSLDGSDFRIASFNVLGASHTGGAHSGTARMNQAADDLLAADLSIVTFQEFEPSQRAVWKQRATGWELWPNDAASSREHNNSVSWNASEWEFVEASAMSIPYFNGKPKPMPVVRLKSLSTGETIHVISVHNPANTRGEAGHWRDEAEKIERERVSSIVANTGDPVFLTGDFNAKRNEIDVPLEGVTNSDRSKGHTGIDWVFTTPEVPITSQEVLGGSYSDHPIVIAGIGEEDATPIMTSVSADTSRSFETDISIRQANIPMRSGDGGLRNSLNTLLSGEPDFVGLNEQSGRSSAKLTSAAPGYAVSRKQINDTGPGSNQQDGNAILYDEVEWSLIAEDQVKVVDNDVSNFHGRLVTWDRYATWATFKRNTDGLVVSYISTHMPTNPGRFGPDRAKRQQMYGEGMDELLDLRGMLSAQGPVFMGGDMNTHASQTQPWTAASKMKGAGYRWFSHGVDFLFSPLTGSIMSNQRTFSIKSDHQAVGADFGLTDAAINPAITNAENDDCTCPTTVTDVDPITTGDTATANARVVYSVFSAWGMPDENIAGILGNWSVESGIDPTSVQGIFDEKYRIGPRKKAMLASGISGFGIGLGQWTAGRHTLLRDYADKYGKDWFELTLQLSFMVAGDNPGDIAIFKSMIAESKGTPADAAVFFEEKWERAGKPDVAARTAAANQWYAQMSGWTADDDLADSILEMAETTLPEVGVVAADGCPVTTAETGFGGLQEGGLTEAQAQSLIDLYLKEGDAFLDARYGNQGGPGSCGDDHAENCVSFSTYFLNKYTSFQQYPTGSPSGDGRYTAGHVARMSGKQLTKTPTAYSIFSTGASGYGHTGVVLGITGDTLLIGEAHYCNGRGNIRLVPASTWKTEAWDFVDVTDLVKGGAPAVAA